MARPSARFTRRLFSVTAPVYDWLTRQETWLEHCASVAELFPPTRPGAPPLRVLDLGIGPGVSGVGLLRRRPELEITGLDLSRRMLRRARRALGDRAGLLAADVAQLPFPAQQFDVVTHHSFLYLLPDRDAALAEIRRVLQPGGRYVLLEPRRRGRFWRIPFLRGALRFRLSMAAWRFIGLRYGKFRRDELTALLTGHGFTDLSLTPTLGGLGYLGDARRG